ncbi:MAG TPA: hypothetical protein VGK30_03250 [Candidatus Binatia bacterium]|jgi:hypothetical protein
MIRTSATVAAAFVLVAQVLAAPARADQVTSAPSGGTLKLKGDANPNVLTIDQAGLNPGQLRVTGAGTTTIDGQASKTFDNVTGGLQVDLGNGDDALTLDTVTLAGTVKIKMGAGMNTLTITAGAYHGTLNVDLGSGDDVLQLCGGTIVDGGLAIKVGAGAGAMRSAACDTTVADNHGSALVIDSAEVGKDVTLKGSKKSESVIVHNTLLHAGLKLALGGGSDAAAICRDPIGGTLSVQMGAGSGGSVTASCGDANDAIGDNALRVDSSSVAANLVLKMSGAADTAILTFGSVDGAIKIDLGQGDNQLTLDALTSQKNVTIKSGKNDDTIQIKNASYGPAASISVKAGAGTNAISLPTSVDVPKNLTIVTGNGDDTIDTTGATVHGTTKITHGKGTDAVTP